MTGRDSKPGSIIHRGDRRGTEQFTLFGDSTDKTICHAVDFVSPEDADHMIDVRHLVDQPAFFKSFGQATCDDDSLCPAGVFEVDHFLYDRLGFLS